MKINAIKVEGMNSNSGTVRGGGNEGRSRIEAAIGELSG